jgi:glycosyltransferase involved in cell wall biosynthesis
VPYVESPATHARIVARKDREIALADWILTASPLAAQSYLRAGVSENRLRMIPIGVDLDNFRPAESGERSEELRFVFAGRASQLKGVDLLFEAQRRLRGLGHRLRLTLIGDRDANVHVPGSPDITLIPRCSTRELAVELPKHDVLVLPSRFDSFGMVVPEAMACGLPVIVSPNAGSSMLVEPEQNGLVMTDLTVDALESCMAWFLNNRDRLSDLAANARKSLHAYTWNAYRARVWSVFSEICASQRI